MFTASQNITRNHGGGKSAFFVIIENIVLSVLKRFRFLEVGIVTEVDARIARVRCNLPYQGRESKWLKVYMPFASNGEGIFAMPNVGDHGLVFFILGDLNAGIFINASWGGAIEIPETDESAQAKDVIIKRNGSWFRLRPNGIVDGVHKNGNRIRISDGFVRTSTPDQTVDGETWYGQKHVAQHYYIKEHRPGAKWEALGFTKSETKKQQSAEIYRRVLDEPQGHIKNMGCKATQVEVGYISPSSNKEETIKEERIQRYVDVGNTEDGELNIVNYSRTTEMKKIPPGADLAFAQGTVVEKNGEIAFHTWIGKKAFAFFSLRVAEKNDQRTASCMIQVMADGRLSDIVVNESGIFLNGVTKEVAKQDDGSAMVAFMDTISKYVFELEETDAVPIPTQEEIERGAVCPICPNPPVEGGSGDGGDFGDNGGGENSGDGGPSFGGEMWPGGEDGGGMEGGIGL